MLEIGELLETIEALTTEQIDAELAEIETQAVALMAPLEKRRTALLRIRRLIESPAVKPGRPERRTTQVAPATSTATGNSLTTVQKLRAYLEVSGPAKVQVIADAVGLTYQQAYAAMNQRKEIFERRGEGLFGLVRH